MIHALIGLGSVIFALLLFGAWIFGMMFLMSWFTDWFLERESQWKRTRRNRKVRSRTTSSTGPGGP